MARPLHKVLAESPGKEILSLQGGSNMGLLHHKRFFRPDEAASILALSRRTVYRMIRDGRITGVKWGKGPWRIPRDSLAILLPGEKF
jgi:excisionase family DNA binding protein